MRKRTLPVHSSSILLKWAHKQSLTHESISCLDKLSVVTFVEYTLTAIDKLRKEKCFYENYFYYQNFMCKSWLLKRNLDNHCNTHNKFKKSLNEKGVRLSIFKVHCS